MRCSCFQPQNRAPGERPCSARGVSGSVQPATEQGTRRAASFKQPQAGHKRKKALLLVLQELLDTLLFLLALRSGLSLEFLQVGHGSARGQACVQCGPYSGGSQDLLLVICYPVRGKPGAARPCTNSWWLLSHDTQHHCLWSLQLSITIVCSFSRPAVFCGETYMSQHTCQMLLCPPCCWRALLQAASCLNVPLHLLSLPLKSIQLPSYRAHTTCP